MIAILGMVQAFAGEQPTTVTATYMGTTDDGYYKFKLESGGELICEDIDYDLDIDMYDDALVGKKFKVTWMYKEIDEYDDEGEPTGKTSKIKYITNIVKQ